MRWRLKIQIIRFYLTVSNWCWPFESSCVAVDYVNNRRCCNQRLICFNSGIYKTCAGVSNLIESSQSIRINRACFDRFNVCKFSGLICFESILHFLFKVCWWIDYNLQKYIIIIFSNSYFFNFPFFRASDWILSDLNIFNLSIVIVNLIEIKF